MRSKAPETSAALVLFALCVCACAQDTTSNASVAERFGLPKGSAISVEEAREIAEALAGTSLQDARVIEETLGGQRRVTFRIGDERHPNAFRTYVIDVTHGRIAGWSRTDPGWFSTEPPAVAPAPLTKEAGLELARDEAARCLGARAEELQWEIECWDPSGTGRARGVLQSQGIEASADFWLPMAEMTAYRQRESGPPDMRDPAVSAEEALAIVAREVGSEDFTVERGPELARGPHPPGWGIWVRTADGEAMTFGIDAISGEVLMVALPKDGSDTPREASRSGAVRRVVARHVARKTWPWVAGVLVLCCGCAAAVRIGRRRRAQVGPPAPVAPSD